MRGQKRLKFILLSSTDRTIADRPCLVVSTVIDLSFHWARLLPSRRGQVAETRLTLSLTATRWHKAPMIACYTVQYGLLPTPQVVMQRWSDTAAVGRCPHGHGDIIGKSPASRSEFTSKNNTRLIGLARRDMSRNADNADMY